VIKSMTKIVKGMCFVTANAWGERLCKPSEAGSIINNWLILDEDSLKMMMMMNTIDVYTSCMSMYLIIMEKDTLLIIMIIQLLL
jgi:hypothetical protein